MIRTVRTACAHDCPDQCSLLATVDDGRLLKLQGDPDHPMTAGFACAKVSSVELCFPGRDAGMLLNYPKVAEDVSRLA